MSIQQKQKGFTIIEVVLVLAIAGLIFSMVFIALPALQRSQRDTARKAEVSTVLAQITSYQSNNRGSAPALNAIFAAYFDGTFAAGVITLGSGTTITKGATPTVTTAVGGVTNDNIVFVMGAKCSSTVGSVDVGTTRQAAALIKLENGNVVYCQTN